MNKAPCILWIECSRDSETTALLDDCRRFWAVTVSTPGRALLALENALPRVIVFDYGDPAKADLHLLQRIKRLYPGAPILMITETHSEELAVWAFRSRVWNYLVKPVTLRELKSNLRQLANLSQSRESPARQMERPATLMPTTHGLLERADEHANMQQIGEKIERDHTAPLQVSALARSCGMSRFRFTRVFKRHFGCNSNEYINRLRVQTACRLLKIHGTSMTQAAIASGFTDASYFARVFRQHMKQSPKEYARQLSQGN